MRAETDKAEDSAAGVTVYGTAWCEVTRALRIYLIQQGVAHGFHNVELEGSSDAAAALTLNGGRYEVPVVVVGDRTIKNPQLGVLRRELGRRGLVDAASDPTAPAAEPGSLPPLEDDQGGL